MCGLMLKVSRHSDIYTTFGFGINSLPNLSSVHLFDLFTGCSLSMQFGSGLSLVRLAHTADMLERHVDLKDDRTDGLLGLPSRPTC